jgi:4-hydroxy-2-oxoheptanedioate aldolase
LDRNPSTSFDVRLRDRETVVGTAVTVPSVALAELVAAPLDFVWIDLEHGALGARDVLPLALAAQGARAAALVRLSSAQSSELGAILDAGVDGVVAPRVQSADQARQLVSRLLLPPRGSRGYATRRASAYGAAAPADPLCWAQIESAEGVAAAPGIAAVEGVDALVVGCADLALSLGESPGGASPRLRDAIQAVQDAAAAAGITSGIAGPDDARLLHELAGGSSTVLVHSADVRICSRAVREAAGALRAAQREVSGVGA